MRPSALWLAGLMALGSMACTRDAAEPEVVKPKAGPAVAKVSKPVPLADEAEQVRWGAQVRKDYLALRRLTQKERGKAIKLMLRLAKRGAAAKGALRALALDPAVAERQRAMAGVMYADLHRFDRSTLAALLADKNPFMARQAALLLARLGGATSRKTLERAVEERPQLALYIRRQLSQLTTRPLPARALSMLHQLLAHTSPDKKRAAATVLAVDYPRQTEAALLALTQLIVADREAQMQAAFALVEANGSAMDKLEAFCKRGQNRFLRYAAMQALAKKGPAGRAILRRLGRQPNEPLKIQINQLLKKTPE